jgi:hypothetical protein
VIPLEEGACLEEVEIRREADCLRAEAAGDGHAGSGSDPDVHFGADTSGCRPALFDGA